MRKTCAWTFGQITGANGIPTPGGGAFGTITDLRSTVAMRQLQLGLKINF